MPFNPLLHCQNEANFSDIIESVGLDTQCRMTSKLVWAIYRQLFEILSNPPEQDIRHTQKKKRPLQCGKWAREKKKKENGGPTCTFLLSLVPGLDPLVLWSRYHPFGLDEADDMLITPFRPWLSLGTQLPCPGRSQATDYIKASF